MEQSEQQPDPNIFVAVVEDNQTISRFLLQQHFAAKINGIYLPISPLEAEPVYEELLPPKFRLNGDYAAKMYVTPDLSRLWDDITTSNALVKVVLLDHHGCVVAPGLDHKQALSEAEFVQAEEIEEEEVLFLMDNDYAEEDALSQSLLWRQLILLEDKRRRASYEKYINDFNPRQQILQVIRRIVQEQNGVVVLQSSFPAGGAKYLQELLNRPGYNLWPYLNRELSAILRANTAIPSLGYKVRAIDYGIRYSEGLLQRLGVRNG